MNALALAALSLLAASPPPAPLAAADPYPAVVGRVASMVRDGEAQRLASQHGLQLLDLTWEDTGRWQGSSVGPNISDVTLEVVSPCAAGERSCAGEKLALMPVLRFPNFSDRTADVRLDRIWLRVGNARGEEDATITLRDFLEDPSRWLSAPLEGSIRGGSLLAPRDTHALVSAQAAFLPVPRRGQATFHPVVFNYQSTAGNPAVLTLLVTRQGTSLTVIDNARDSVRGSWGQRLFFNAGGERAPLTAERISDVLDRGVTMNGESAASLGEDANLLMLVQVPLRYRERPRRELSLMAQAPAAAGAAKSAMAAEDRASDLEVAVIGHGPLQGPFTELAGLQVERDPRFPVRVTVQFYQATASGQVTGPQMAHLASLVGKVYAKGDFVGSLVVPGPGDPRRPTAWDGASPPPREVAWWDFPGLVERWRMRGRMPPAGIR
jgi:hypothetical protein